MNVSLMFQFAKERTPDKLAIVDGNIRLTYKQWGDRVERLAQHLAGIGIRKGDKAAICMENSETNVTAFFALQLLGAVPVPFNFRSKKDGILYHLKDSEAKMILFSDLTAGTIEESISELPDSMIFVNAGQKEHRKFRSFTLLMASAPEQAVSYPELSDNDLSCILYTSGTTGEPKGIPLTHENSIFRILGLALNSGYLHQNEDKMIGLMPLFHTVGIHAVLLSSVMFNHTYYPIQQFDPVKILELIENEKITHMFGTPTHFQMMLKVEGFESYDLSSLRHILYAGAPMSSSLARECGEKFCDNLTLIYGNTETYNGLYMRNTQNYSSISVCGVFHNIRLVKFGGSPEDRISQGEEGELIIDMRSPESFAHYLKKPQQTEKKVINGWYYTGDAFKLIEEGVVQYSGRVDDMIISGGENIHPCEVEEHILSHPSVKDAAIIGMPDERWGQLVKAFIVRKDHTLEVDMIDNFLRGSTLENFKRPREYEFIDAIPRNPSGKILRSTLMTMSVPGGQQ